MPAETATGGQARRRQSFAAETAKAALAPPGAVQAGAHARELRPCLGRGGRRGAGGRAGSPPPPRLRRGCQSQGQATCIDRIAARLFEDGTQREEFSQVPAARRLGGRARLRGARGRIATGAGPGMGADRSRSSPAGSSAVAASGRRRARRTACSACWRPTAATSRACTSA